MIRFFSSCSNTDAITSSQDFKQELYQKKIEIESLNHRFVCRLSPLCDFRKRWDSIEAETVSRQVRPYYNNLMYQCNSTLKHFNIFLSSTSWSLRCWAWVSFRTPQMSCMPGSLTQLTYYRPLIQSALTCRPVRQSQPNTRYERNSNSKVL